MFRFVSKYLFLKCNYISNNIGCLSDLWLYFGRLSNLNIKDWMAILAVSVFKGGVRWSRCWTYMMAKVSEMNRQNFFQNFSIFPSAGGLAGKVLLAFSYTQSTHLHTPLLQFHTPLCRFIIHPFCTDLRSILTLEASDPKESGTVPKFFKMTPSILLWQQIGMQTQNCILDGVILENSGTLADSLGSD